MSARKQKSTGAFLASGGNNGPSGASEAVCRPEYSTEYNIRLTLSGQVDCWRADIGISYIVYYLTVVIMVGHILLPNFIKNHVRVDREFAMQAISWLSGFCSAQMSVTSWFHCHRYPMEHGIVTDWNDMERIWQYIYSKDQLKTSSEEVT